MRDFCPLCPRPDVLPWPDPWPRPTLFFLARDPEGGLRLSSRILLLSAIGLLDLLYFDHVLDCPNHPANGWIVFLHHHRLMVAEP